MSALRRPVQDGPGHELRQRTTGNVQIAEAQMHPRQSRQKRRIAEFQANWSNIKTELPPQLSRRHIGMISIGGVIGTGLFVGSATALQDGGPIGALLAYAIMGSVVYCLCVSIGEIISFLPNVGGVVGLADLYVDPALGFSLGWAAWYNWCVTLPVEVTAAAVVIRFWDQCEHIKTSVWTTVFLIGAVFINLFPSRVYGEMEFIFSTIKITTIVFLIVSSLIIDLGASGVWYGLDSWTQPFTKDYMGIHGPKGRFLGFWSCLMQAGFSFFGSEVPGIAAGEVINATMNVPRALRRVWVRITLFYLGGIFVAGLIVPTGRNTDQSPPTCSSGNQTSTLPLGTANSSPFVQIFNKANVPGLAHLVNAAILISAWSAAASDVYIGSRFLFFLARRGHAPGFLALLTRYPRQSATEPLPPTAFESSALSSPDIARLPPVRTPSSHSPRIASAPSGSPSLTNHVGDIEASPVPEPKQKRSSDFVLPLASVVVSSSVGLLAYLSAKAGGPAEAFNWLGTVTSVASLQAWTGMLFTYIRLYNGTRYAEKHGNDLAAIRRIKKHRHRGQPYLAWYALVMCILILFTNGWAVFLSDGWRIADQKGIVPDKPKSEAGPGTLSRVPAFLSAYIPIPFFIILTVGYKLVHQTRLVPLNRMTFSVENIPEEEEMPKPRNLWERIWYTII